jgi:hypothetical protein
MISNLAKTSVAGIKSIQYLRSMYLSSCGDGVVVRGFLREREVRHCTELLDSSCELKYTVFSDGE